MKPRFLTSHYAWIQGCYWMAYCILLSFSSVYLLDQGFSNTQIGLLLGLSGLLTALLQPFVGARADHLKVLSLGQFAALLILAMLLCTGGLLLLPGQAVQGGLFLSLLILLQLLTSLLYALGMDCVNQGMPRWPPPSAAAQPPLSVQSVSLRCWAGRPSCCWRPPFPSGPVPQPSRQPHPQRPRHRLPSPFGGAIPGSSPCWPGWFFSTPATIFS